MRLQLKTKIVFLVVMFIITVASGCRPGPANYCSTFCVGGRRYDIFYDTISGCPFRQISNVGCPGAPLGVVGTLTYSRNCQGNCNFITVLERSFFNVQLTANPSGVDLNAPPTSIVIAGQFFDTTYGMPRVEYSDQNSGYLIGTAYASSVSADGTLLTVELPDLSQAYSGSYGVKVTNKTASGYYVNEVGVTNINCWGRDRPDSDGDGWFDDEDCYPFDPDRWDCRIEPCLGQNLPSNAPVLPLPCDQY